MKRKYIDTDKINQSMRKPLERQTCKDRRSSFLYYWLLDDFGELLKELPYGTSPDVIKPLGNRVVKIYEDRSTNFKEECLF